MLNLNMQDANTTHWVVFSVSSLKIYFGGRFKTPNIEYDFINEINTSYTELQNIYKGEFIIGIFENLAWRADIKYLFELGHYYHYFKVSLLIIFSLLFRKRRLMPDIKWVKLPLIHSARWNSRAGYCLIANFLQPNWQQRYHRS